MEHEARCPLRWQTGAFEVSKLLVLADLTDDLESGRVVVFDADRLRVRRLPSSNALGART